jgi:stage III sporulation protein AB
MIDLVIKIAGAACIMAAAAAYGELKARRLAQRLNQLQQFQQSLKLLAVEISFARSVLPEAFQAVGSQCAPPIRDLYHAAAEALAGGKELTAGEAWREAVRRISPASSFTPADREIIKGIGVSLGASEREGQLQQIRLTERRLELALEEARDDHSRRAKLWRYLGYLGGAAIVILLL